MTLLKVWTSIIMDRAFVIDTNSVYVVIYWSEKGGYKSVEWYKSRIRLIAQKIGLVHETIIYEILHIDKNVHD